MYMQHVTYARLNEHIKFRKGVLIVTGDPDPLNALKSTLIYPAVVDITGVLPRRYPEPAVPIPARSRIRIGGVVR